jgi:hypothetical protein
VVYTNESKCTIFVSTCGTLHFVDDVVDAVVHVWFDDVVDVEIDDVA